MSVFVSITSPEAALLLTDAASYDDTGRVRKIASKVTRARHAPVAVTSRGHAEGGEVLAQAICAVADEFGADVLFENLQQFVDDLRDNFGATFDGSNAIQVLIAGFVRGKGQHRSFSTVKTLQGYGQPAWRVFEPPAIFATGAYLDSADIIAAGVPPKRLDESMSTYVQAVGADLLEIMRKRPAAVHGTDRVIYGVGGHVDMTTIDPDGARTVTLRTWPDRVGELILP